MNALLKWGENPMDSKDLRIFSDDDPRIAGISKSHPNAEALAAEITDRFNLYPQLVEALRQISSLWPEPPNCADIMAVSGINDGKSRAILADAAIQISRAILSKVDQQKEANNVSGI